MIKRITAILLSLAILLPSALLWGNSSFLKTSAGSVYSALTSGVRQIGSGLSNSAKEIDKAASDYIGLHDLFINVYGLGMRLCGNRLVNVGSRVVARLNSGSLVEYNTDEAQVEKEAETAKKNAASLAGLKETLDKKNIPLLFVLAPGKPDKNDPGLPYGLKDYGNAAADSFLKELDDLGVDYLDLRDLWQQNGWSVDDGFFSSDLHWRPEYAIRSWGYVTQYLNDHYGVVNDPSLFDLNNLKLEKYENVSLGGTGRILGKYYAKTDGTELYIPKYETKLHVVNKRVGWDKTGTFEETTVDRSQMDRGSIFRNDLIDMYRVRDSVVENYKAPNDANVVFIRDSFGGMLGGYVPLAFKNTSIIDPRTMDEREGETVRSIINDFDTDLVLVFYHIGMVTQANMFEFEDTPVGKVSEQP